MVNVIYISRGYIKSLALGYDLHFIDFDYFLPSIFWLRQ